MGNRAKAAGNVPAEPNVARVYNYLLGGRDNFSIDRQHSNRMTREVPGAPAGVHAQRAVLLRVVRYLVADAGIRQLLDIGAGLPGEKNVHQIAQFVAPETRVVYVDNDPVVMSHARAVLAENPAVIAVPGDLRDPAGIIGNPALRGHLDWTQPIGLLLSGIMHLIPESDRPGRLTAELIDALPAGSYVYIQHLLDLDHPVSVRLKATMRQTFRDIQFRTLDQVRELFCGLELVPPGLVPVPDWRPDTEAPADPVGPRALGLACAGVARKP